MTEPYGVKGCICFCEDYTASYNGHAEERWMPNAGCRYHGVLSDFIPDRNDTGTYRVIKVEPEDRAVRPEPEPEPDTVTKGWRLQDGRLVADVIEEPVSDPDVARASLPPSAFGLDVPDAGPADCAWGVPFSCRVHCPPTTEEESQRGLRAAVRRIGRWFVGGGVTRRS